MLEGEIVSAQAAEQVIQIMVPAALKKAIKRSALERDETPRILVPRAFRDPGLHVDEAEPCDPRRGGRW